MTEHEAFGGVTVDHLYPDCPALLAATRRLPPDRDTWIGNRLFGTVDPEGSDICGLCRRRWETKQ